MSRSFVLAEFKLTCALAKMLANTSSQHGGRLRTLFVVAHAIGASLHLSPPRGALETPEGSNFSAPEGGKLLADERGIALTPEGGTLSYAPEGGKFPLPASFLSCGAARFDSCGGLQQTWPFLCFCYGIPLLLALCALTRMKWTKKKNRCVVAARKAGKSRFRQKRRSSRCVFVIDLHIWPVLLGVSCNRYFFLLVTHCSS